MPGGRVGKISDLKASGSRVLAATPILLGLHQDRKKDQAPLASRLPLPIDARPARPSGATPPGARSARVRPPERLAPATSPTAWTRTVAGYDLDRRVRSSGLCGLSGWSGRPAIWP